MHYQPKQDLLNDRIILVTGASDGIGREAAMTYARYGATVILLGRNEEKLRQVASHINEEIGRQPQWFILDLLTCTSEDCQLSFYNTESESGCCGSSGWQRICDCGYSGYH